MLLHYLVREAVQRALAEDIGRGDITTDALIDGGAQASARLMAREQGIVAGLDLAEAAFRGVEPDIVFERLIADGHPVKAGDIIARISGSARALLSAERVALNFITHMSGIASLTGRYVAAIAGTRARIVDTRKTLPGLRVFEKYAVRMGGGVNHRFALDDAAMIKDNHIVAAGGIGPAIRQVRAAIGHMVKICCEVDRIDQIEEALAAGVDVLLLDNMGPETLAEAVRLIAGRATAEASGKVSLDTVAAIAASGVDVISVGRLTHSAPALDIALDFDGVSALVTPRLQLREWRNSDLTPFAALNADPEVMRYFPEPLDRSASDAMVGRIRDHFERHGFGPWAVEIPGVVDCAGFVGLMVPAFDAHFTPCVEIGWRLARAVWGRGYATEAARAALDYAFDVLKTDEVVAMTVPSNRLSRAVMERLGMTRDSADDFDHPRLSEGHMLRRHVLYRKRHG